MKIQKNQKNLKGITLIALVITIIVLLILAGITINLLFSNNGVIKKAQTANTEYMISQAKERLILVLSGAQIEKQTNYKYNEQDYLDEYILEKVKDVEILGDIVIVDGYAFSLDRSIPKIGEYIGEKEELVFPEVTAVVNLAEDFKTATIVIKAKEERSGIAKIEVLQDGFVLQDYSYENIKEEITENYVAKQNGKYSIKVYSKLNITKRIQVEGLVSTVEYSPNGDTTYKKEHSVQVKVEEDVDKVQSIKYQWLKTTVEPEEETFIETCNNQETIKKNGITGKWYLWTLLETVSGKENIGRSEAFYFDNAGPTTTLTATPISETSFTLTATAKDNETQVEKYEFYVNDELKKTINSQEQTVSYQITDVNMGSYNCYVITTDSVGNTQKTSANGKTQMYTWEKWSINETRTYKLNSSSEIRSYSSGNISVAEGYSFDSKTGILKGTGNIRDKKITESNSGLGPLYQYKLESSNKITYFAAFNKFGEYSGGKYSGAYWNVTDYISVLSNTTYSKGTTQYSNTTSTTDSKYPTNGKDGSYWYVYKGIL